MNIKNVNRLLLLLWLCTFPVKGSVFQVSLYALPILALAIPQIRQYFIGLKKEFFFILCCLFMPFLLLEVYVFLIQGTTPDKDLFNKFWRLCVFPIACVAILSQEKDPLKMLKLLFVFVAVFYGLSAIFSSIFEISLNERDFGNRNAGFISNPNPFGFLMGAGLIVAGSLVGFFERCSYKMLCLIGCIILLRGLMVSGARSAVLGILVVSILWGAYLLLKKQRNIFKTFCYIVPLLIIVCGLLVSNVQFFETFIERMKTIQNGDIRLEIWAIYIELLKATPLTGLTLRDSVEVVVRGVSFAPHNIYLTALVEGGVFALFGLVLFLSVLLIKSYQIGWEKGGGVPFLLTIYIMIYCFFNSPFYGHIVTQGVMTIIIILTLLLHFKRTSLSAVEYKKVS